MKGALHLKNRNLILGLTFILVFSAFSTAMASSSTHSTRWDHTNDSTYGSYAPDTGGGYNSLSDTASDGQDYCSDYIDMRITEIDYDSAAVQSIHDYYNNNSYYPTLNVTDTADLADAYNAWYATNWPNEKWDTDDDSFNGPDEEAEVTSLSRLQVSASTDYYFYIDWDVPSQTDYSCDPDFRC